MDAAVLQKSSLFKGIPAQELREILDNVPYRIRSYDKGETIFRLMEEADRLAILLEGLVQARKPFPNGSQVNVSLRRPGEMIGPAAVFSIDRRYPCDAVALEKSTVMMFERGDVLSLLQKDIRILENFTTEVASAAYMLQQRLELLSYSGIAQKAAFFLLMQMRQTGKSRVRIPESVSNWAMIMNVSRPSLHRELKRLDTEGIISYAPPFVEIIDRIRLQNTLSG